MLNRFVKNFVEREGVKYVTEVPIREISVNPYQPRRNFNREKLEELARSIEELGVVQPIIVRKMKGGYELVTGERRLRACKLAGLSTIPAIIRALDDQAVIEITFIENMQREQLDDVETAEAYGRLLEIPGGLEAAAERVGKNALSFEQGIWALELPGVVKKAISSGLITPDQARLIASFKSKNKQIEILEKMASSNSGFNSGIEGDTLAPRNGERGDYDKLEAFISLVRELMAVLRSSGIKAKVSENFSGNSLDIKLSFNIEDKQN